MQDRAQPWTPQLAVLEYRSPQARDELRDDATADEALLCGTSPATERLRGRCVSLAQAGLNTALIVGEPGSGKERVAFWLHRRSRRAARPLAIIEGARPDSLVQIANLRNLLQAHDGPGNLVVRDVHRADPTVLQALLAMLVDQGVELRCGLLLLSNVSIGELRQRSLLHEQLLGRAAGSVVEVPPLRERLDDLPTLAAALVVEATHRYGRTIRGLAPTVVRRLQCHSFPGNCRELTAILEQAVLRCDGDWIGESCLTGLPSAESMVAPVDGDELLIRLPGSSLREIELQAVRIALRLASGRVTRAAELLGITRHALRRKLDKFGLHDLRRSFGDVMDGDDDEDAFI